jgi:hypothetical protein
MEPWQIRAIGPWGSLKIELAKSNRELTWHFGYNIARYLGEEDIGTWEIKPANSEEWENIS